MKQATYQIEKVGFESDSTEKSRGFQKVQNHKKNLHKEKYDKEMKNQGFKLKVKRKKLLPKSDGQRLTRRERDGRTEEQKQSTQTKQTKKIVRRQKN